MDDGDCRKVSYLHARDPSILSWGCTNLHKLKCDLRDYMSLIGPEEPEDKVKQIEVFLRIKCGDLLDMYDIQDNTLTCKIPANSKNNKNGERVYKKYTFSKIFPPTTEQKEIFDHIVKPRVLNFINGNSTTLLTYGASGAGKTFTIVGTPEDPGLLPRVLEYLFKSLPEISEVPSIKLNYDGSFQWMDLPEGKKEVEHLHSIINSPYIAANKSSLEQIYRNMQNRLSCEPVAEIDENNSTSMGIWISFAEIYNEQAYDLLEWSTSTDKQRPKLKVCNNKGLTYIKNLKHIHVSSGLQAFQLLHSGLMNLKYAATAVNAHSSRSHSIFSIKLVHSYSDDEIKISQFNFCDLAGSERSKKTHNIGVRLKESNNINTSLLVLGKCISILRGSQKHPENKKLVPFRESKLTQLFQKALTGLEDILMIVNVNPIREMFDESLHALNFSAIAKDVKIESRQQENNKRKVEESEVEELKMEIERLQRQLNDVYETLEDKEVECEQNESEARHELTSYYTNYIKKLEETHKKKMEEANKIIQELRGRLNKRMKLDESVISLNSSSEETSQEEIETSQNSSVLEDYSTS